MTRTATRRRPFARARCAVVAVALGLALPAAAQAQSFDCGKAKRPTEVVICADPALGRADTILGVLFKDVYAAVPADRRKAMYRAQIAWLQARETVCGMPKSGDLSAEAKAEKARCLLRETRARIRTLERYYKAATGNAHRLAGQTAPAQQPPSGTEVKRLDDALQ